MAKLKEVALLAILASVSATIAINILAPWQESYLRAEAARTAEIRDAVVTAREYADDSAGAWTVDMQSRGLGGEAGIPYQLFLGRDGVYINLGIDIKTHSCASDFIGREWPVGSKVKLEYVGLADPARPSHWSSYVKPVPVVADQ